MCSWLWTCAYQHVIFNKISWRAGWKMYKLAFPRGGHVDAPSLIISRAVSVRFGLWKAAQPTEMAGKAGRICRDEMAKALQKNWMSSGVGYVKSGPKGERDPRYWWPSTNRQTWEMHAGLCKFPACHNGEPWVSCQRPNNLFDKRTHINVYSQTTSVWFTPTSLNSTAWQQLAPFSTLQHCSMPNGDGWANMPNDRYVNPYGHIAWSDWVLVIMKGAARRESV